MCWSAKRYLIVHFALFNCADAFGPILLRFHSKTMQDLRCKTSNFVNMSFLFIVVYHKMALQRFELQLFETKIITHEKVQSDDKRVMDRPNEQTIFAEHSWAGAVDSEKPPAEPLLH